MHVFFDAEKTIAETTQTPHAVTKKMFMRLREVCAYLH
jgi:hypothetical protein